MGMWGSVGRAGFWQGCVGKWEALDEGGHRAPGIAGMAGKRGWRRGEILEIHEIAPGENWEIGWTRMDGRGTWKGTFRCHQELEESSPEFPNFQHCWRWAQPQFQRILGMREGTSGDTLGQGDTSDLLPVFPVWICWDGPERPRDAPGHFVPKATP